MPVSILCEVDPSEKHEISVSVIIKINELIVSGDDSGKLKVWSSDLKLIKQKDTESGAIIAIAAGPDKIYTITSDQTVKEWALSSLDLLRTIPTDSIPQKLFYEGTTGLLWVGDSTGRVTKYEDGKEMGRYELTEEIWDFLVTANPTLVFTARDRDIVVSEIVQGELRSNAVVKGTIEGRYPILLHENLLYCMDRDGRNIRVHEIVPPKFKMLREIPAAKMIVNALCLGTGSSLYCGGYDAEVALWDTNKGENLGAATVGSCVNALATSPKGAYAALADGRIVLVGP